MCLRRAIWSELQHLLPIPHRRQPVCLHVGSQRVSTCALSDSRISHLSPNTLGILLMRTRGVSPILCRMFGRMVGAAALRGEKKVSAKRYLYLCVNTHNIKLVLLSAAGVKTRTLVLTCRQVFIAMGVLKLFKQTNLCTVNFSHKHIEVFFSGAESKHLTNLGICE